MVENNEQGRAARRYFIECEHSALRQQASAPQSALPSAKLSPEHARALQEAVAARADLMPAHRRAAAYAKLWGALKSHFHVPTYRELPDAEFNAALSLIGRLPLEAPALAAPAVETPPSLTTRRWLISYDPTGKEQVQAVPNDACVMSLPQALQLLTDPDGPQIDTQLLADFIGAASQKLARRCAWHQGRAAALKGGKP